MTSRDVTIAGFIAVFATAAFLVITSWIRPGWLARFGEIVRTACRRHIVIRATVLFAWGWLGWHFLARTVG
jgi:hypothetical protein